MQTKIKEEEKQEKDFKGFPKLMKNKEYDYIVLFLDAYAGVIIYSSDFYHKTGGYCSYWDINHFKDFNGTIELKN